MDTETGQIYDRRDPEQEAALRRDLLAGHPIVPISDRVARVQRIGQSRLRQRRKRQRQARRAGRK